MNFKVLSPLESSNSSSRETFSGRTPLQKIVRPLRKKCNTKRTMWSYLDELVISSELWLPFLGLVRTRGIGLTSVFYLPLELAYCQLRILEIGRRPIFFLRKIKYWKYFRFFWKIFWKWHTKKWNLLKTSKMRLLFGWKREDFETFLPGDAIPEICQLSENQIKNTAFSRALPYCAE